MFAEGASHSRPLALCFTCLSLHDALINFVLFCFKTELSKFKLVPKASSEIQPRKIERNRHLKVMFSRRHEICKGLNLKYSVMYAFSSLLNLHFPVSPHLDASREIKFMKRLLRAVCCVWCELVHVPFLSLPSPLTHIYQLTQLIQ